MHWARHRVIIWNFQIGSVFCEASLLNGSQERSNERSLAERFSTDTTPEIINRTCLGSRIFLPPNLGVDLKFKSQTFHIKICGHRSEAASLWSHLRCSFSNKNYFHIRTALSVRSRIHSVIPSIGWCFFLQRFGNELLRPTGPLPDFCATRLVSRDDISGDTA